jgi:amino acid transporter
MKNLFLSALCIIFSFTASAQCAMCRATAESASQNSGGSIAEGLNSGIVYLMLIPYVLLTVVVLVFFRKKIINFFKAE